MKVLMWPVILGCAVPWRPGNFWKGPGKIVGVACVGGAVPRGDPNWEFLPECNVTLFATWRCGNPEGVWNYWRYRAERWAETWAQRLMSLMIGGISGFLLYSQGGALMACRVVGIYTLFIYTSKPFVMLKTSGRRDSPQSPESAWIVKSNVKLGIGQKFVHITHLNIFIDKYLNCKKNGG